MKTCNKCGTEKQKSEFSKASAKKDGLHSECKSCAAVRSAKHKAINAAENVKSHEKNMDGVKSCSACGVDKPRFEFSRALGRKGGLRGECKACLAARRETSKDIAAARSAAYYYANKSKVAARFAEYYANNPEVFSANARNRRARVRSSEGSHTADDVRAIFESQRGLCAACTTRLIKSGKDKYHVDHIMPIAKGGGNGPDNLQCLCPDCNRRKSAKLPEQWAKENGRLI